jgi:hypothetical protein
MAKFSKKQYVAIADVIHTFLCASNYMTLNVYNVSSTLVSSMIEMFEKDNPAFDAERFRRACYGTHQTDSNLQGRVR